MSPARSARIGIRVVVGALGVLAVAGALSGALVPTASASVGSVPAEVRDYVADGGLVARLADLYGPDASGERGIEFDDSTTTGEILRVHVWTDAKLAGEAGASPVRLENEWVVPVAVAEQPVGLATVWINPETVLPELAVFDPDPELATALADVPDAAALVHDAGADAWFALEEGVLAPLVAGRSGLASPAPVDDVAVIPPDPDAAATPEDTSGLPLAIAVVVVLLVVVVIAAVLPGRSRRPADEAAGEPEEESEEEPEAVAEPEAAAEPDPAER